MDAERVGAARSQRARSTAGLRQCLPSQGAAAPHHLSPCRPAPAHLLTAGHLHKLGRPAVLRRLPLHAHELQALPSSTGEYRGGVAVSRQPAARCTVLLDCQPRRPVLPCKAPGALPSSACGRQADHAHLEVALPVINEALGQHLRTGLQPGAGHVNSQARPARLCGAKPLPLLPGSSSSSGGLSPCAPGRGSSSSGGAGSCPGGNPPRRRAGRGRTRGWPRRGRSQP